MFTAGTKRGRRELGGIGQKSGQYWALDPGTGAVAWVTQVDPGGLTGGLQCGAVLRDFTSGGACQAGAAISGGTVYWGSGYQAALGLTPNDKLYALAPL